MRIKYRRLSLFFALMTLHYATGGKIYTAHDTELFSESTPEVIDEKEVIRRGLIDDIMGALEGVVSVTEDVLSVILLPVRELIKLDQDAIVENPYRDEDAEIRRGCPVCDEELEFRDRRFMVVKRAQEQLTGMQLDDEDVLEITFSGSGGGMRAKSYSLGSCVGADKIGLLDCITCMSGLSGSTWFLAPWISSATPIGQYRERAIEDACAGIDITSVEDLGPMFDALWVKLAYGQTITPIDFFGGWLANNFLRGYGKEQHMVYLSDQRDIIADGTFPLPVYTAVLAHRDMPNHWFEYTPYEVGSRWLGAYMPAWAYGRKCKRGESKSSAPEQSLGYMMGTFGSAIAASAEEAYDKAIKHMELPKFLRGLPAAEQIFDGLKKMFEKIVRQTDVGDIRLTWAQVFNYVYKMRNCNFNRKKDLKFADAGVDLSNPIFATYRNGSHGDAPDIIFVLDSSSDICMERLELAASYAQRENLRFPIIDQADVEHNACTVFGDIEDVDTPLVVYMPRVVDQSLLARYQDDPELSDFVEQLKGFDIEEAVDSGFAGTFKFEYTREQAELIANLAEFNMRALENEIKSIIATRIAAKRMKRSVS